MNNYNWNILEQDRLDSTLFNIVDRFSNQTDSFSISQSLFAKATINDITSNVEHINLGKDENISQIHHKKNDLNIFIEKGFNKYVNYGMDKYVYENSISEIYSSDVLDQYYNQQIDQTFINPLVFKFDLNTLLEYFTHDSTLNDLLLDSSGCITKIFFNIRNPVVIDSTILSSNEIYNQYIEESSAYFKNKATILKSSLALNRYLYDHLNSHNRTSFIFMDFSNETSFIDLYYYQLQYTEENLIISLYKSTVPFCQYHKIIDCQNTFNNVYTNYSYLTVFDVCQCSYSLDIGYATHKYQSGHVPNIIEDVNRNDSIHNLNYNNINYVYSAVPFSKQYIKTDKILDLSVELLNITDFDYSNIIHYTIGDPKIHRSIADREFISLYSFNILDSNNKQFIIPIDVTTVFNNDISIIVNNVLEKNECLLTELNFINCSYDLTSWIINQDVFSILDSVSIQEYNTDEAIISIDTTSINITQNNLLNIAVSSDNTITKIVTGQYPSPYIVIDRNLLGVKDPQPMTMFNIIPDDSQHENYSDRYHTPFGSCHNGYLYSLCWRGQQENAGTFAQDTVIPNNCLSQQCGSPQMNKSLNSSIIPITYKNSSNQYFIPVNISQGIVHVGMVDIESLPDQKLYENNSEVIGYYNSIYNQFYSVEFKPISDTALLEFKIQKLDKTTINIPINEILITGSIRYLYHKIQQDIFPYTYIFPDETGININCILSDGDSVKNEVYSRINLEKENILTGSVHSYQTFTPLFCDLYTLDPWHSLDGIRYGSRTYIKPIDLINDTTCIVYDDYKNEINCYYSKLSDGSSSQIYTLLGSSFNKYDTFGGGRHGGQGIIIKPDKTTLFQHSFTSDPTMIIVKNQDAIISRFPSTSFVPLQGAFPVIYDSSTFFDSYGSHLIKRFNLINSGDYYSITSTDVTYGTVVGIEPDGTTLTIQDGLHFIFYSVPDNTYNETTQSLTRSQYEQFCYHHSNGKYYILGSDNSNMNIKIFFRASYEGTIQTIEKEWVVQDMLDLQLNENILYSSSFLRPIDTSTQYGYFNASTSSIKPFAFKLEVFEEDDTAITFIDNNQLKMEYPLYVKDERTKISRNSLYTRERGALINGEFVVLIAGSPFQLNEYYSNIMIYAKCQDEELIDYLCISNYDVLSASSTNTLAESNSLLLISPSIFINTKNIYWASTDSTSLLEELNMHRINIFNANINNSESNIKLYRKYFVKSFPVTQFRGETVKQGGLGVEYKGLVIYPAYETNDTYVIGGKTIPKITTYIKNYYLYSDSVQTKKVASFDKFIDQIQSSYFYGLVDKNKRIQIDGTNILYDSNGNIYKYIVDKNISDRVNILPHNNFYWKRSFSTNSNYVTGAAFIKMHTYYYGTIEYDFVISLIRYSKERNRYYNLGEGIQTANIDNLFASTGNYWEKEWFDYCDKRYTVSNRALIADTWDQMTIIKTTLYKINSMNRVNIFDDQSNTMYYQTVPIHRISTNPIFYSNVLTSDICPETFNEYQNCVHTTSDGSHQSLGYGLYQKKSIYDKINVHKVCMYDYQYSFGFNANYKVLRNAQINDQPSQNFGTLKKWVHNSNITGYSFNNDQNIIGATVQLTATPDFTPNSFVKTDSTTLHVIGVSKIDQTVGINCEFSDYGRSSPIYLRKQYQDVTFGIFTTYEDTTCEVFSAFSPTINFSDITFKHLNYLIDWYMDISVSDSTGNSNDIIFENPANVFKKFNNNKHNWLAWTSFYKKDNSVDVYTLFPAMSKMIKCKIEYDSSITYSSALLQHMFKQIIYDATVDILDISDNLFYYYPLSISYDNSLMQLGSDISSIITSISLVDGTVISQYDNKSPIYKKRIGSIFELTYNKQYGNDYIKYQTLLGEDGTIYNDHAIDIITEHIIDNKNVDTTDVIITSTNNVVDIIYNDITIFGVSIGDKVRYIDKNQIYDGSNIIIIDIEVRDINAQSNKNISIVISKNNQYQNIVGESFDLVRDGSSSYHKNEIIQTILNGSLSIGEVVEISTYPLDTTATMIKFYDYDERSFKCFDPKYGLIYKVKGTSIYDGVFFYGDTTYISYDDYGKQSGEFAIQDNMHSLMQYHDKLPNIYFTPYKTDDIQGYPIPYTYDQTNMIFLYNAPIGVKKVKFDFDIIAMINYNLKLFNTAKDIVESQFVTEKIGDFSGYFPYLNFILEKKPGANEYNLFKRYIKVWADYTFVDFTNTFPSSSFLGLDTSYDSLNTASGGLVVYYGRQPNYDHMLLTTGYFKDYTDDNSNQSGKLNPKPIYLSDMLPYNFCSYNDNTIYTEQRLIPSFINESAVEFYVNVGCIQNLHNNYELTDQVIDYQIGNEYFNYQFINNNDLTYLFPTYQKVFYMKTIGSLYVKYDGNTYSIVNKDIKTKKYDYVNDNTFTKIDRTFNKYDFIQIKKVSEDQTKAWFKQLGNFSDSTLNCFGSGLSFGVINCNSNYNLDKPLVMPGEVSYRGGDILRSDQDKAIVLSPGQIIKGYQRTNSVHYHRFEFGYYSNTQQHPHLLLKLDYVDYYSYATDSTWCSPRELITDPGIQFNDNLHMIMWNKEPYQQWQTGAVGIFLTIGLHSDATEDVTVFGFQQDAPYVPNDISCFGEIRSTTVDNSNNQHHYKLNYTRYDDITESITMASIDLDDNVDNTITIQSSNNDYSVIMLSQDISNSLNIITDGTNSQDSTSINLTNVIKYRLKIKPESTRSSPVIIDVNSPHINEQTIICIKKI